MPRTIVASALFLLSVACSGGGGSSTSGDTTTTTRVIGIGGGTLSVQNHAGDVLTLEIPPLALDEDTAVTLSALPTAPTSPIKDSIYPGAVLEPSGLVFSLPVTVTVALRRPLPGPGALLSYLKASDYALPLANQAALAAQNGIQGELHHFSQVFVGIPTADEIRSMDSKILSQPFTTPEDLLDRVDSLLALGKAMDDQGYDITTFDPVADAKDLLESGIATILGSPLPDDPCGRYTLLMRSLVTLIDELGLPQSVDEPLLDRTCKFSVSQPTLPVYVGVPSEEVVTASLLDPGGNPRACPRITWYSSNWNVVGVEPHGMGCVPTAVAPGNAEVWANCEGQVAAAQLSVLCGLHGTWQGPYSGQTIRCAARDANDRCIQWGGLKDFSGTAVVPFAQTGTTVTAVIAGFTFTGTNTGGPVTLTAMLPCAADTATCPGQITGTFAPGCSAFSGSLLDARSRTIAGTFTLYPTP